MYSADKVLQIITYLLSLNNGRMDLLKLMKELYLIDRRSIEERDSSLSGDVFCSMPHGPVLSQTLNMLTMLPDYPSWFEYLDSSRKMYYPDIVLKKQLPELDRLSEKDKSYIREISDKFKDYTEFQIEDYTHKLPEWVDPNGSSRKIRFQDVMRALQKSDAEILAAKKEYDALNELCHAG